MQLIEVCVVGHKLLDLMVGEGSSSFACSKLLQLQQIYNKLFKMCLAHVITTKRFHIKSFVLQD